MSDLGSDLRLARERAGLSLDGLSARTKIRTGLLEAIERGDFERLPSGLLTRGYLRAYAKEVGLDPELVIRRYRTESEGPDFIAARPPQRTDAELHSIVRRIQSGVGIVVLTAIAAFFLYQERRAQSDINGQLNVASTSGYEGTTITPPPDTVNRPPPDTNRLTVRIAPTDVVWVQATADGRRVLYSLIHPDQPREIEASEELVLLVGDAGAFRYTIDGVRGRSLGGARQVREVRITRQNRVEFQDP